MNEDFGRLKVIDRFVVGRFHYFLCECSCGRRIKVRKDHLVNGRTDSCTVCSGYKVTAVDDATLIREYKGGATANALCKRYGTNHRYLRRLFDREGVERMTRSESVLNGQASMTEEQRLKCYSHAIGKPRDEATLCKSARTRELRGKLNSREAYVVSLLRQCDLLVWPQRAEGRYNIDVALPELNLAVELFSWMHETETRKKGYRRRCDFILGRGWRMLVVWYASTILDARVLAPILLLGNSKEKIGREIIAYSDGSIVDDADYDFSSGVLLERRRYGRDCC